MPKTALDSERFRLRIALVLMLLMLGSVLTFIWNLQVVKGHTFNDNIEAQSIRRIRLPGKRGRVFDRNNVCLADNRPSHCLAIFLHELRQPGRLTNTVAKVDRMIDEISNLLEVERQVDYEAVKKHVFKTRLLPLIAWQDLDEQAIARWAERVQGFQGVDLYTRAVRVYPKNELACHSLGYVGRSGSASEDEEEYDYYLPEMEGKAGLEKVYDGLLRGEAGGELLRIDVSGYKYDTMESRPPTSGSDIRLTLDAEIQALCEKVLDNEAGSICVMDPNNGDVLALASYPGFNLNKMVPFIPSRLWNELINDKRKPLICRAIHEQYPPGSTIKGLIALQALMAGTATEDTEFFCPGYFELGGRVMHCGFRSGHGPVNMRQAIERSCNVYFWHLGLESGYPSIYNMLDSIGLGQKTGLEVDYEVPGILPNHDWKRKNYPKESGWRDGDTCNVSIGQGYLNVTPLQMAVATATLANGGKRVKPRLIQAIRDAETGSYVNQPAAQATPLNWPPAALNVVREGMRDVVMSSRGTARSARIDGLDYAAKTGTAQFGQRGNRKYRSWMIAWAPYDNPKVAISLVIDSGGGASVAAAPRIRLLMQALYNRGLVGPVKKEAVHGS